MPLSVRRLPRAKADLLDLWLHIAADSVAAADKLADHIEQAVLMLGQYPESGPERNNMGTGIRMFPVENFVIYYRVEPQFVAIIRILHSSRDVTPETIAENRPNPP